MNKIIFEKYKENQKITLSLYSKTSEILRATYIVVDMFLSSCSVYLEYEYNISTKELNRTVCRGAFIDVMESTTPREDFSLDYCLKYYDSSEEELKNMIMQEVSIYKTE